MNKKFKIYFACAIRGEQGGKAEKDFIVGTMKDLGHEVLSEIFTAQDLKDNDLRTMTPGQIYQRDMDWMADSDVVVADVSRISFGVGYEIGWKLGTGGRVLALCRRDRLEGLSNMIKGCKADGFTLKTWKEFGELKQILTENLGAVNE